MAIANGTAMWAKVHRAAPNYNQDGYEYTIDLIVDKAEAAKLKEAGANVKEKDGELIVKFKLKELNSKGEKNTPPVVVDRDNIPLKADIGNGSKVKVQYRSFDWEFGKKKGRSVQLMGVQVLELVEYAGGNRAGDEFSAISEEESGF